MKKINRLSAVSLLAVLAVSCFANNAKAADILDLNFASVTDQGLITALQDAEVFWESRLLGIRRDIPRALAANWSKIQITAIQFDIDGAGMAAADASITSTIRYNGVPGFPGFPGPFGGSRPWELAQSSLLRFDNDDFPFLTQDVLTAVAIHEMGHALGIGSLWGQNELTAVQPATGLVQYTGEAALREYQQVIGDPTRSFVPLEQLGGPGTAGVHWSLEFPFIDPVTGAAEFLTGFVAPTSFLSTITEEALFDLGFANRFNPLAWESGTFGGFPSKFGIGPPPFSFPPTRVTGIPEPSSIALLVGLCTVAATRRRRR